MQILLAEDNETNRQVATKLTESLGHTVDCVENGYDAVEKVLAGNYDVVLMDVQMPIVDGREATKRIREALKDSGGGPKIIAVTANVLLGERESCFESGMDDYIPKPLRLAELQRALKAVEENMAASAPDSAKTSATTGLIDSEQLLAAIDPEDEECIEIYAEFCSAAVTDIASIAEFLSKADLPAAAALAHQLKGSSATLGFASLSKWASDLEQNAKQGEVQLPENWREAVDSTFAAARKEADSLLQMA